MIQPATWRSLEMDFPLKLLEKTPGWLTPWLWSWAEDTEDKVELGQTSDLQNCELINLCCFFFELWIKGAQLCPTLCDPMNCKPTRLLCPWDFPNKNTGVDCHFLLQEIFPTQGLNPRLLHCRQMLYHLSYQGATTFVVIFYGSNRKLMHRSQGHCNTGGHDLLQWRAPAPPNSFLPSSSLLGSKSIFLKNFPFSA